jgi:hypothetical protein
VTALETGSSDKNEVDRKVALSKSIRQSAFQDDDDEDKE